MTALLLVARGTQPVLHVINIEGITMKRAFKKSVAVAAMSTILLQGCATTGTTGTDGKTSTGEKVGTSVAVGAAACGITLLMGGKGEDCAKAFVVAGFATFLAQVIVENKKVADAAKVNQEAQKAGFKIPKNEVKPLSFDVALQPGAAVKAGDKVVLASTAKLYGNGNSKIEQSTQLYDEENKPVGKPRIEVFKPEGGAAGAYASNATYSVPNGWSGRKFNFKTALLVDGKEVANNSNAKMTVMAEAPSKRHFLASLKN